MNTLIKNLFKSVPAIALLLSSMTTLAGPIDDAARYWKFDGDYIDSNNGANSTEIGGVTFGTDRDGNSNSALSLDGFNDAVRIDQSSDLGALSSFTLSMWFKLDTSNDRSYLFDTRAPGSTGYDGAFVFMDPLGGASTRLYGYPSPGGSNNVTANLFDQNWHHVSVVRDTSAAQSRLYLDGVLESVSNTNSTLINMDDGLVIGSYGLATPGGPYWTDGSIDDVALWSRALSDTEISSVFSAPASGTQSVPEPGSLVLAMLAFMFLGWTKRAYLLEINRKSNY